MIIYEGIYKLVGGLEKNSIYMERSNKVHPNLRKSK